MRTKIHGLINSQCITARRRHKRVLTSLIFLISAVFFCACAGSSGNASEQSTAPGSEGTGTPGTLSSETGANEKAVSSREYSFTLPEYIPSIYVDQTGFDTGEEKTVLFGKGQSGDTFELRKAADDALVYTGKIKTSNMAGADRLYGSFSSFQTEGKYYIYTDEAGSSYSFDIKENISEERLNNALVNFYLHRCGTAVDEKELTGSLSPLNGSAYISHTDCHTAAARLRTDETLEADVYGGWHTGEYGDRNVSLGAGALRDLLLAYELYPDGFSGDFSADILDEMLYEAKWLLSMQNENGGVYAEVLTGGNEQSANLTLADISSDATLIFAEVMARFSVVYEDTDSEYASDALTAAKKAWAYYTGREDAYENTASFAAAAQLYRATGEWQYENVLTYFFSLDDFSELFKSDMNVFYGSLAYLNCLQAINPDDIILIRTLLDENASDIADASGASAYMVSAGTLDEMFENAVRLCAANAFGHSYEYTEIIRDHIHFLYGRNEDALNLVASDTERTFADAGEDGIYDSLTYCAALVMMLAAV